MAGKSPSWLRRVMIFHSPGGWPIWTCTGLLVLEDPRDKKIYEVHFDPSTVRIDGDLVVGAEVSVSADFDGARYTTNSIIINSAPASQ